MAVSQQPAAMPVLSRGRYRGPVRGACFLEYTALVAGEPFSDHPACVDGELAAVLRHANDRLSDGDRFRLTPLLGRAIGLVVPVRRDRPDGRAAPGAGRAGWTGRPQPSTTRPSASSGRWSPGASRPLSVPTRPPRSGAGTPAAGTSTGSSGP